MALIIVIQMIPLIQMIQMIQLRRSFEGMGLLPVRGSAGLMRELKSC